MRRVHTEFSVYSEKLFIQRDVQQIFNQILIVLYIYVCMYVGYHHKNVSSCENFTETTVSINYILLPCSLHRIRNDSRHGEWHSWKIQLTKVWIQFTVMWLCPYLAVPSRLIAEHSWSHHDPIFAMVIYYLHWVLAVQFYIAIYVFYWIKFPITMKITFTIAFVDAGHYRSFVAVYFCINWLLLDDIQCVQSLSLKAQGNIIYLWRKGREFD